MPRLEFFLHDWWFLIFLFNWVFVCSFVSFVPFQLSDWNFVQRFVLHVQNKPFMPNLYERTFYNLKAWKTCHLTVQNQAFVAGATKLLNSIVGYILMTIKHKELKLPQKFTYQLSHNVHKISVWNVIFKAFLVIQLRETSRVESHQGPSSIHFKSDTL